MVIPERTSKKPITQSVDLVDIHELIKENNFGYCPWTSIGGSPINEILLRVTSDRWDVFAGGQSNMFYLK